MGYPAHTEFELMATIESSRSIQLTIFLALAVSNMRKNSELAYVDNEAHDIGE